MSYERPSLRRADRQRVPSGEYRRLDAADARHLRAHLLRLNPEDLRNRFMGSRQRSLILRYVRAIDWQRALIVGCFIGRSLRGVCELHPMTGRRGEVAVSVERRFQRRGVGVELLGRTLVLARNRNLTDLELRCFSSNQGIRRLIGHFGGSVEVDVTEACALIHSLPPTPATYVSEMVEQAGIVGSSLIRLWLHGGSVAPERWGYRCWRTPDLFAAGD